MNEVYVVTREGIYIQGIVGIFTTKEKAEEAMRAAAKREPDEYHSFDYDIFEIDVIYKLWI